MPDRVVVDPITLALGVGEARFVTARLIAVGGEVITNIPLSFTTSAPTIAAVSTTGEVFGVAPGTATVTATAANKSATVAVTVTLSPPASITVTLAHTELLKVSDTVRATAVVRDAQGNVLLRQVTWTTSDPTVALVTPDGLVLGISPGGPVVITATVAGTTGTAVVAVIPALIANIIITPDSANLVIGSTVQFAAQIQDEFGIPVTDRTVTWSSFVPEVATVSATGLVTAVSIGSTLLIATVEGIARQVVVRVTAVPVAKFRIEVTNYLRYSIDIVVNGVPVGSIPASSVGIVERPLLPMGTITWRLTPAGTQGETITDLLGTVVNPVQGSTFAYVVDNVLNNGTTYFLPVIRNISTSKVLLDFPVRTNPAFCEDCISSFEDPAPKIFGYWKLTPATTMDLYRSTDGTRTGPKISIAVPAAEVTPLTGEWQYTILVGP